MHAASQHTLYATSTTDSLTRWKHAIRLGNLAFENGDCSQACSHYLQALELAASLFGSHSNADEATALWVISHHNLADTCERLGQTDEQRDWLIAAHDHLCQAVHDARLPEAWRMAALSHSRRTYGELLRFLRRHPDDMAARLACQQGAAGPVGLPQ